MSDVEMGRRTGSLGEAVHGASVRLMIASLVGWTFLWVYLRESIFFPHFLHLPFGEFAPFAFLGFVVVALGIASAMAVCRRSVRVWACDGRVVCAISVMGTIGLAALLLGETTPGAPGIFFNCLCYLAYALAFCTVFFAWIYEARRQAFTLGIEVEVVLQFVAVFASYILTDDVDEFTWRVPLQAAGLAVAGIAFLAVWSRRHSTQTLRAAAGADAADEKRPRFETNADGAAEPGGTGDAPAGSALWAEAASGESLDMSRRLVPWFALLGVSLAVTGMLAYSWHFDDRGYSETGVNVLVDVFTFAIMAAMAVFAFYMSRRFVAGNRMPISLCFAVVMAALVVFFVVTITLTLADSNLFGLARIIKRIARVATFMTVLVLVYQCDLDPAAPFVFAFLVPSVAPRALQMSLAASPWGRSLALEGDNLMAILLATGFFLVMCLVVFCMLNMDGGLARGILREDSRDAGSSVDAAHPTCEPTGFAMDTACEAIGREYGLTRREREVMRMFAEGASAQEVAVAFSVSVGTVNSHARTLYRKLDIHSKRELADLVGIRMGL